MAFIPSKKQILPKFDFIYVFNLTHQSHTKFLHCRKCQIGIDMHLVKPEAGNETSAEPITSSLFRRSNQQS